MSMNQKSGFFLFLAAVSILGFSACQTDRGERMPAHRVLEYNDQGPKAIAKLYPTQNSDVYGTVTFTKSINAIRVEADLYNLSPGDHGFHIHEHGDCSAPDASSAGGHFNPLESLHGGPDSTHRHAGDLGNITADMNGRAHMDRLYTYISFEGTNSVIGRSVIVHATRDDLISQPSGNSGARVACGVIRWVR